MRADLRGPHDLGEIVGYAYRLYLRNFIPFFLIALTTAPLQLLIGVIQDRIDDPQTAQSATAPLQLLSVVVSLVATGALIRAVDAAATGTPSDAMQALAPDARRRAPLPGQARGADHHPPLHVAVDRVAHEKDSIASIRSS